MANTRINTQVAAGDLVTDAVKPLLTETEVNRLITLQIEAKATDEAVRAELLDIKSLLSQQLEVMRRPSAPAGAKVTVASRPASASAALNHVAGGHN